MGIFNRIRGGASAGRGDDPHGVTQGTSFHGLYPQLMSWGSAQSGSTTYEVGKNYANNHTRIKGDWAVGAINSGGRYYPTAMSARHFNDYSAINKDMQVGNLGFKSPRQARRAAIQGIKQNNGLPQSPDGARAADGIVHDLQSDPFRIW